MLRNTSYEQPDFFQYLEYHRIPKNHILLQIDSQISLSFTNELLAIKYSRPDVLGEIKSLGVNAYIPISHSAYRIQEELFFYNKDSDTWTCINGNESGTGRKKKKEGTDLIEYRFERECCRNCPHRARCLGKAKNIARKLIVGTSTAELYEHSQFTKSEGFLERYKVRARIEPKNSEMKRFHGLDRAKGFGLQSVFLQAMFTAITVNMKRMVAIIR